mgnify:CR=1 FL=1
MDYDCTKPLGEHLKDYIASNLKDICFELLLHGIVYENQFDKLCSMACKMNSIELSDLFAYSTKKHIWYAYDNITCNFVFYDMDRYQSDEAIQLSITYQKKHGG